MQGLVHENWRQSDDSNLLVVGRLQREGEGLGAVGTLEHAAWPQLAKLGQRECGRGLMLCIHQRYQRHLQDILE